MDPMTALLADSLSNLMTGLGTQKDKSQAGRFHGRQRLGRYTTDALYHQNWLGGKIVDAPADDATRLWRVWDGSKRVVEAMEEAEKALDLRAKVNRAVKLAAKDGGSAILIGAGGPPEEPLDPNAVGRGGIAYLHVVSRYDLSETTIIRDPQSPWFGQPVQYRMFKPDGTTVGIHPSRVLRFVNQPRLDLLGWDDPWGDSIYERLHDPMRDAIAAFQGVASLMQEAKVDVIKIPGLSAGVRNEEYRAGVLKRFGLANMLKSISNTLLMDAAEEWAHKTQTFTGFPEVLDRLLLVVAGATDIPLTRLLGRSPAGMNATGESDLESYYNLISSRQETLLRPSLAPLDEMLIRHALGRKPRGIHYDWRPLWNLSETERADVDVKRAQATKHYADAKIFDPRALAKATVNRMEEDGFMPGLAEAVAEFPTQEPTPPPDPNTPSPGGGNPRASAIGRPGLPATAPP